MDAKNFDSVISNYRLVKGQAWTIPITLDMPVDKHTEIKKSSVVDLYFNKEYVAKIKVTDVFSFSKSKIFKLFGTTNLEHPGVKKELSRSPNRIGCKILKFQKSILKDALNPSEMKKIFKQKKWNTVIGFQTRNPVHRAHEYLQRLGMELCDGLLINPLVGWKKKGDFSQPSIQAAYEVMIQQFYPQERVIYRELKTQMRYAGPKEAVFHAIIRRNIGCTHFIIGRDHAGVGSYYGIYEAHSFARKIMKDHDLGIKLILAKEPYFCSKCDGIVSENHCSHYHTHRIEVSGTIIRKALSEGKIPDTKMMRQEVAESIIALGAGKFVGETH